MVERAKLIVHRTLAGLGRRIQMMCIRDPIRDFFALGYALITHGAPRASS
jgi:hypothetical protein